MVGLKHIKDVLYYDIQGCKLTGCPYPSYLIQGPPGCSKSTVAGIIASLTGGQIHKVLGADLNKPEAIYNLAVAAKDNDVIFIEEAHTIGGSGKNSKIVQAILLEWIENHQILGGDAYGVLQVPKVCILLPTTNPGRLTHALRTRCRTLSTSYFSVNDLCEIIRRACDKIGIAATDEEAVELLAQSSRGTPRVAVMNRLDRLQKIMAVDNVGFTKQSVEKLFAIDGINEYGLEYGDIKYCEMLYIKMEDNGGKPVAKNTLVQSLGMSEDMVSTVIESYLQQIGAIQVNGRGRILMPLGYEILGKAPPSTGPVDVLKARSVDSDKLTAFLEGRQKTSLEEVAVFLGLRPTKDNGLIKAHLRKVGYEVRRKSGIVKTAKPSES